MKCGYGWTETHGSAPGQGPLCPEGQGTRQARPIRRWQRPLSDRRPLRRQAVGPANGSLAEARERAVTYRRMARDGGDPVAEKRRIHVKAIERALTKAGVEFVEADKKGEGCGCASRENNARVSDRPRPAISRTNVWSRRTLTIRRSWNSGGFRARRRACSSICSTRVTARLATIISSAPSSSLAWPNVLAASSSDEQSGRCSRRVSARDNPDARPRLPRTAPPAEPRSPPFPATDRKR